MKLRVVELLLVTTLPALVLAQNGIPSVGLSIATILGGTLAAGSANAFNMVIESETDKLMKRTAQRPIATGVLSRSEATVFATVVGLLSLLIFWIFTTPLATWLTLIAIVFYVVIYTMALKRRTSQNIVWGGIAGCMPVLIGWAAVTNELSNVAWAFFFVIFFWTPPHFWALAIKYKRSRNSDVARCHFAEEFTWSNVVPHDCHVHCFSYNNQLCRTFTLGANCECNIVFSFCANACATSWQ
jgi:protoheme IX farnesyltransferase